MRLWLPGSQEEFCCCLFPAQNFILPHIFCNATTMNVMHTALSWYSSGNVPRSCFKSRFHDQFFKENDSISSVQGRVGKGDKLLAETLVRG